MRYRTLGRTGLSVSEIGFGAWAIGGGWGEQKESDSVAAPHRALDLGGNFVDTAAGYGDGRVVFDEGVLTGKYTRESRFPPDDFRSRYFAGDRLERAVARTERVRNHAWVRGFWYSGK